MITRNKRRARRKQALLSSRIGGKIDEMDAVDEAGIDIGEIVADIDDAVPRHGGWTQTPASSSSLTHAIWAIAKYHCGNSNLNSSIQIFDSAC